MTDTATRAPASSLPAGLEHYRSTPVFTETALPAALRNDHRTKDGVWGVIRVLSGALRYSVTDPARDPLTIDLTPAIPGIIEPAILHRVEPLGEVEFQVEFHRAIRKKVSC